MRSCPVCSSTARTLLLTMPTSQTINSCEECGMVYSDGLPPMDYSRDSIYTCAETYQSQRTHYERIVANLMLAGATVDQTVLDVGCATGGLMKTLLEAGFQNVSGISLSSGEVELCRSLGLNAAVSDLTESAHPTYDLITLSHVLEHVPSPTDLLRNLSRWLKPSGKLYLEVPDALGYSACFTSICQGFNSEHINHFDLTHLMMMMERTGYRTMRSGEYAVTAERADSLYPCAWVMVKGPWNSPALRHSIEEYRDKLVPQIDSVRAHLSRELSGDFVIWGIGETARLLIADGTIDAYLAIAGTDTNPVYHDKVVNGIYIYPPDLFRPPANLPILVCSQTRQQEIIDAIHRLGLTNRIITL